jgi:hypothetical protein
LQDRGASDETPPLSSQRHIGSGGGLFTRSGSEAHPLSVERLPAILNRYNLWWNVPR